MGYQLPLRHSQPEAISQDSRTQDRSWCQGVLGILYDIPIGWKGRHEEMHRCKRAQPGMQFFQAPCQGLYAQWHTILELDQPTGMRLLPYFGHKTPDLAY